MESKIYVDPKGVLKYVKEMPKEPNVKMSELDANCHPEYGYQLEYEWDLHNKALQKAKDEAVEFQDHNTIFFILQDAHMPKGANEWGFEPDTFYPIPSGYKVEVIDQFRRLEDDIQWRTIYEPFPRADFSEYRKVAILSPQESKDEYIKQQEEHAKNFGGI
jgi:hypothetical protein